MSVNKNYKDILESFSKKILSLDSNSDLSDLKSETCENFNIYTNNYLYTVIDRLSIDYPGTFKYLGKNNFSFFVRKMLLTCGITSPNFEDFSSTFPGYLESEKEIHQDLLLVSISRVDRLWSFEKETFIITFKGMLLFWRELLNEASSDNRIDLSKTEKIELVSINGENFLKAVEISNV